MSKRFTECKNTKESNTHKKVDSSDVDETCDIPQQYNADCINKSEFCDTDSLKVNSTVISEPAKGDTAQTESVLSTSHSEMNMSGGLTLSVNMFSLHARCASLSSTSSDDSGDEATTLIGKNITNERHPSCKGGSTLKPRKTITLNSLSSNPSSDDLSETVKPRKLANETKEGTSGESTGLILGTPPRIILRHKPMTNIGSSEGDS